MTKNNNLPQFTIKQLLDAGVHFGHKTMRRNTKMSQYIHSNRNGLSIIDLKKTGARLYKAMEVAKDVAKNNGKILFVATKKQATDVVVEAATKCNQYYVNNRWLGGMLTNWKTVSQSIKTLSDTEEQLKNDSLGLNKKEKIDLERKRLKLEMSLGGIRNMNGFPDLIFIIDSFREALAINEAKKLGIPIIAVLDTNSNPDNITYPIPGNDDSIKAIKLYCHLIADAALIGMQEKNIKSGSIVQSATKNIDKKVDTSDKSKQKKDNNDKSEVENSDKNKITKTVKTKKIIAKNNTTKDNNKKAPSKTTTKSENPKTKTKVEIKKVVTKKVSIKKEDKK